MSRRKDRERYLRLKQQDAAYTGFRGLEVKAAPPSPPVLESVVCSVCHRKRNVPAASLPDDRDSYICLSCQEEGRGDSQVASAVQATPQA